MRARLQHIDNTKAIGMFLIVACHVIPNDMVIPFMDIWSDVLGSFHVPLFFILSGIFESSTLDRKKYGMRLLKLVKYIVIFYVYGFFTDGLINQHWSLTSYKSQTTIWFLFTLLWISALVGFLKQYKYKSLIYSILVGGGIAISYNSMSCMYLGQACLCLPFYLAGYHFKEYFKQTNLNINVFVLSSMIWLLCFVIFYSPQNVSLNFVSQNYLAFYIEAFAGSIVIIELSKLIHSKALSYYGQNTIVPMLVQFSLIWCLCKVLQVDTIYLYILCSIIVCIITGLCIPIFRNKKYDIFK